MRLDPNPMFRRVITPWYDSTTACWIILVFMVLVALFSWAGIAAARSVPAYNNYFWLPVILLFLSLLGGISVSYRLIRRHYERHYQKHEP